MYEPQHKEVIVESVNRISRQLNRTMPYLADELQVWMKDLAGSLEPADYFMHPVAFPFLLLPWWLEHQLSGEHDETFQADLAYSCANIYYHVRMIDNLMDGHEAGELALLPATGFFVSQFQGVYHRYFSHDHPFWDFYMMAWHHMCDCTAQDTRLEDIDAATFTQLVSQKVCGAKIPIAAVCYRYHRPDLVPLWSHWIDSFGCWHLFEEDLFDWHKDLSLGTVTYFLSEARRRRLPGEIDIVWMAREGFDWALETLDRWMREIRQMTFVPGEVGTYLDQRERTLMTRKDSISATLQTLLKLTESVS